MCHLQVHAVGYLSNPFLSNLNLEGDIPSIIMIPLPVDPDSGVVSGVLESFFDVLGCGHVFHLKLTWHYRYIYFYIVKVFTI